MKSLRLKVVDAVGIKGRTVNIEQIEAVEQLLASEKRELLERLDVEYQKSPNYFARVLEAEKAKL